MGRKKKKTHEDDGGNQAKLEATVHPCSGGEFFLEVSFSQGATRKKVSPSE